MGNYIKKISLGTKLYLFVILTVLVVSLGTAMIAYKISVNKIDNYYKSLTLNSARNFSAFVDPDYLKSLKEAVVTDEYQALREKAEEEQNEQLIEDYLRDKGLWEQYNETRDLLIRYLRNMQDIKYLYIIVWGTANESVDMYLLDDDENPIYVTGSFGEREEEFAEVDESKEIAPRVSNGDWGWLCSAYVPLYASDGTLVCQIGCDVDMDDVMMQRQQYMLYIALAALIITVVVLVIAVLFTNKIIVKPLNAITNEMKKFKPEGNADYEKAGVIDLDIRTRDEINDIYLGIRSMQINIIDYICDITRVQKEKEKAETEAREKEAQIGKISKEAYRDSLTSVGSKTAYIKKAEDLNSCILKGRKVEFAFVLVDINDLKMVNDSYGHTAGDEYIKGCCHIICETFKHSPVFRIGGDEFVAVLQNEDYLNRQELFETLKEKYLSTFSDTAEKPWQRYSAAVGMAEYSLDDSKVEFVFKRADKAMYSDKLRFKTEHGSYR